MVNRSLERALEIKRLRMELKQCPAGSPESERRWARIDELLDKHLADKGAHPADCGCDDCAQVVFEALARRFSVGELSDLRDIATPGQW